MLVESEISAPVSVLELKFALVQDSAREAVLIVHPVTGLAVVVSCVGELALPGEAEDHFRRTKLAKLFE
jgi:hypothetical protein